MSVEDTIVFEIEKDLNRIIIAFEKRIKKHRSLLECWEENRKRRRLMKSYGGGMSIVTLVCNCRPHPVVNNTPLRLRKVHHEELCCCATVHLAVAHAVSGPSGPATE